MAKYERQMCKQSHWLPRKRLFKRVSACVRRLHIQVLDRSALKGRGSHFVSCQHDERLPNSLINDQENVEIVAFKSRARMSALETSATCNAAARSLRSLAHQIVLRDVRESFFCCFFALICWFGNLGLNSQMFPSRCIKWVTCGAAGNFIQLPQHARWQTVTSGSRFSSPPLSPNVSEHFRQIWTSSTTPLFFDAQFIAECSDTWETLRVLSETLT